MFRPFHKGLQLGRNFNVCIEDTVYCSFELRRMGGFEEEAGFVRFECILYPSLLDDGTVRVK